ncbi:hypothetical protein CE168_07225 [Bifidobacterium sp. N5G01]|uniref:class III lanthipeptide n=1 Tax=uncultured Bifidobacterium sp. TaxID=165187 RepID=UPI000C15DD1B|nr:hypothetical protein CE168_07225 [Bifidobacterium sp. N5G01]
MDHIYANEHCVHCRLLTILLKKISMKWILELQQLLLPEEEPDDGGSTISIAFVCKKESTISLLFCMDR